MIVASIHQAFLYSYATISMAPFSLTEVALTTVSDVDVRDSRRTKPMRVLTLTGVRHVLSVQPTLRL